MTSPHSLKGRKPYHYGARDFNDAAQQYNTHRNKFPTVIVAGLAGFRERPYFTAQAGSEVAPTVDFSTEK